MIIQCGETRLQPSSAHPRALEARVAAIGRTNYAVCFGDTIIENNQSGNWNSSDQFEACSFCSHHLVSET